QQKLNTPENLEALTAPEPDMPEFAWSRQQLRADLQKALQLLPKHYRQVILWREVEEMSFEEIGALLGKTPATVRVLLFRAKKRCRELLEEVQGHERQ
ncbi:MAG: sigma-70 family RNA polymerase sigma factor, partial [Moorella sp. (in: Bacteria)]|nr:sigma-70 family RNA polymerase sigma factor [Moorella sp. (in: firmicutes)]